tara:strand:+ start:898 stop:1065 length:168 start_codon:yes stop_codon:yes gene_type:complete
VEEENLVKKKQRKDGVHVLGTGENVLVDVNLVEKKVKNANAEANVNVVIKDKLVE